MKWRKRIMKMMYKLFTYLIIMISIIAGFSIFQKYYIQSVDQELQEKIAEYKNRIDINRNNCE